jgi:hypothetical protein
MECRFVPNPPSPQQLYEGALNTVGLDVGVTAGGVMGWGCWRPRLALHQEPLPANTSVQVEMWELDLAPASTCWSAAPVEASLCNRFQSRDPWPLTLRSACRDFSYARLTDLGRQDLI